MFHHRQVPAAVALAAFCSCSMGAPSPDEPPDETTEALVRDLRIGFVRPSGEIVWPVETLEEPRRFALPLWSKEREARRRIWKPDLQPDPEWVGEERLRLSVGTTANVLHDGHTHPVVIEGFTILRAGCGEAEPGWRARTMPAHEDPDQGSVGDPALWTSPYPHRQRPFPVLVSLDGVQQPPVAAVEGELPAGLLIALAERNLLEGEHRSLRTRRVWTVYGARTVDARGRNVGSLRSTWSESSDGYRLLAEKATNPTFEEMILKWVDPENHSYNFDSAVGQVHAKFEQGGRVFFLTRYLGWESERVFLEELRAGGLVRILHDGLDRGC